MSDGKDDKTRTNRVIARSGDDGRTGLADGSRTAKEHPPIQALGASSEERRAGTECRSRCAPCQ